MTYLFAMATLVCLLLAMATALLNWDSMSWIYGAAAYVFGFLTILVWLVGFLR